MYFDSWSTSYFFWVIACFAVWALAGVSVYGAINVFTSKYKKTKGTKVLSLERIRELKREAEHETILSAAGQTRREKEVIIKSAETFANSVRGTEEKGQQGKESSGQEKTREISPGMFLSKEAVNEKLREIYEKEVKRTREKATEDMRTDQELQEVMNKTFNGSGNTEGKEKQQVQETAGGERLRWMDMEDIFRTAFRSG
jgi:hypothetical protein